MTRLPPTRYRLALAGVALSLMLLVPGLVRPVLTVSGTLDTQGIAELAPVLLARGLTDSTVDALRPMLNPALVPFMEMAPGGLKGLLVTTLSTEIAGSLQGGEPVVVYTQTRSILGSVQHLYSVGSATAATLILLFSVLVPVAKSLLVTWAVLQSRSEARRSTLNFVEAIAKWSMADVFAVALIIAYLAAQASQSVPGPGVSPPLVVFHASFGSGFYWFAAYCVVSLAMQQITARLIAGTSQTDR